MTSRGSSNSARDKLLDAAVTLIRRNGFAATSVDQLCAAAGVTKGAFFHHFVSKEALGVAAAGHWLAITTPLFADADGFVAQRALGFPVRVRKRRWDGCQNRPCRSTARRTGASITQR
ncbi:helix-turn-helix domain-containing protein [Sphingomonas sp. Ant20]|uniref:TetR/AcrR family transcriptional regulator n=1 Tax=Sphingomonas sp. Ant20 TaxID=104605 RepID=UPI0009FD4732|nr:helix-turn-helix domain-containing protein [Sphingomonas sp. Ant20]